MPVIEAVGVAHPIGTPQNKRAYTAMLVALAAAQKKGVTDPDKLKATMMDARDKVKNT